MTSRTQEAARCACMNLRRATRALTRFYDDRLRDAGITTPQFTLLVALETLGSSSVGELSEYLTMDRTTATRNLDRLEERGLVDSAPGEEDARRRMVDLTGEGRDVLRDAYPDWKGAQASVVGELGEEDFEELLTLVNRITEITRG